MGSRCVRAAGADRVIGQLVHAWSDHGGVDGEGPGFVTVMRTADMPASAVRMAVSCSGHRVGLDERHEDSFICDVHHIEPEEIADRRDGPVHRQRAVLQHHAHSRGSRDLVEGAGQSATGGIPQDVHRGARGVSRAAGR